MNKLKTLSAKLYLEGKGLVNYNSTTPTAEQNKRFYPILNHNGKIPDNCMFAKEHVYKDGEKLIVRKIIDSNLMRKVSIGCENEPIAKTISDNPSLKLKYISSLPMIARGWMYTLENKSKDTGTIIKRKSGVMITDAEQICTAITSMKVGSKEGPRDSNSYRYKETCGEIHYMSEINFDVKQLQFISVDDNYDRMSIYEKEVEEYLHYLNKYGYDAKKGIFSTTHDNLVGEQGIVLPDKAIYDMIRIIVKKFLDIYIYRAGSYAKTEKFVIILDGKEIDIKTIEDFDSLGLQFGCDLVEIK